MHRFVLVLGSLLIASGVGACGGSGAGDASSSDGTEAASTSSGSGGAMPADFSIACQEPFMAYCVEYANLTGSQDETVQTGCAYNHGKFVAHCPTMSLLGICARLVPKLGVGVTDKEFYYAIPGLGADSVESACKGAGGMWTPAADAGT